MKIIVRANVNARKNEVEKINDGEYLVHTTAIPVENKDNEKIIELLSTYFGIAQERLLILQGSSAQIKIVQIFDRKTI